MPNSPYKKRFVIAVLNFLNHDEIWIILFRLDTN